MVLLCEVAQSSEERSTCMDMGNMGTRGHGGMGVGAWAWRHRRRRIYNTQPRPKTQHPTHHPPHITYHHPTYLRGGIEDGAPIMEGGRTWTWRTAYGVSTKACSWLTGCEMVVDTGTSVIVGPPSAAVDAVAAVGAEIVSVTKIP